MKQVKIRAPGVSVILRKNIGRKTVSGAAAVSERFAGQNRKIDLTPFFGENGRVSVRKSVREPAGSFSITFSDRMAVDQDTVYGLVEPMDVVEIRMAGDEYRHPNLAPTTTQGQSSSLPIMMRGIVSRVDRHESIGPDGHPQRSVTISGQDYGKIWQILQVINSPYVNPEANLITALPFFARFGKEINTDYAEKFVADVFDLVINPFIKEMRQQAGGGASNSPLMEISTKGILVRDGKVSPFGVGGWGGGTIYSLFSEHCDVGPWNELFIEDREDAPTVVYRPNPFKMVDTGKYIIESAEKPVHVNITRGDVVSMDVSRSDEHVANYFWVDSPRFLMNYGEVARMMAQYAKPDEVFVKNYGNINPKLYGARRMFEQTNQCGRGELYNGNGLKSDEHTIVTGEAIKWINDRRKQLIDMNKDNVVLESGGLVLKGNEAVKPGRYLRLTHGGMVSDYYAVSVSHDFVPLQRYVTSVEVERGMGFVSRVRRGGGKQSPYLGELGDGA